MPQAIDGFQRGSPPDAERLFGARTGVVPQGPTAPETKAQQGAKSGELLTLLLTPGDFADYKPSQGKGLQTNDRKSSKQPVVGSNPTGGVELTAGTQHQPHHKQQASGTHHRENPIGVGRPGHRASLPELQRSTRDQKLQRPPKASRMRPTKLSWRSTSCQASMRAAKSSQVRRCSAACR